MPMWWRQGSGTSLLRGEGTQKSSSSGGVQLAHGGSSNAGKPQEEEKSYRDKIIEDYEAELEEARKWAYKIGVLHVISQFVAFCNLTWATVALLGAFLPDLYARDFAFITCLLFIEAGRLASASFFLRVLMRPLAYRSQDPKKINHSEDGQYPASLRVRLSSKLVQFLLIAPGVVVPIIGHVLLSNYSGTRNLESSIRIFYSSIALNSFIALANLICSDRAFNVLNKPPEQSILRYFDTVLDNGMSSGIVQADVFEFFNFAYTTLGGEYRRNVQPEAVAKNHKGLIQYLYVHRLGPDALKVFLEADDPFVQLAAVNMVGFWADRTWDVGVPEKELKLPEELLMKLADKVGTGQLGWAATNSFGALAGTPKGAKMVAKARTSSNMGLTDHLADLVDETSSRSLSLVRTLVGFYEQLCVHEPQAPLFSKDESNLEHFVQKLEKLAKEAGVQRLRVMAAYFLLLMGKRCNPEVILAIDPEKDTYWFTTEVRMLELLRSHIPDAPPLHLPDFSKPDPKKPDAKPKPFLRKGHDIIAPPWAYSTSHAA